MQRDLSDITIILDRSGSMSSIRADAEDGLNTFIEKQKQQPGRANFTLVQFDHEYQIVHNGIPIASVPHCTLEPRGNTALYDAIGRTINDIGARLKSLPESDRPGLVCVVILTDGMENASREYTAARVKEMIEHQTNVYKWQFTYLGANQDAFLVAGAIGIPKAASANYATAAVGGALAAASSNVVRMRHASACGQSVINAYNADEQEAMLLDPSKATDADAK